MPFSSLSYFKYENFSYFEIEKILLYRFPYVGKKFSLLPNTTAWFSLCRTRLRTLIHLYGLVIFGHHPTSTPQRPDLSTRASHFDLKVNADHSEACLSPTSGLVQVLL